MDNDRSHKGLEVICIQPLGFIDLKLLAFLAGNLPGLLGIRGRIPILNPKPMPREAFNELRGQFHSTSILRYMSKLPEQIGCLKVLGVTEEDLFVPGFNFVFGEAILGGNVAVISLARLRPEFYGYPPNNRLLAERALKEALHELGHAFGLPHCRKRTCVMRFSNSIRDTDEKPAEFCGRCRTQLNSILSDVGLTPPR